MWENTRKYAIIKREAIMITVTNGKEFIKISSKYLQKNANGYLIKPEFSYWMIDLVIIVEDKNITKIIKTLPYGEEVLDSFNNLEKSSHEILLAEEDFRRFKKLYINMRSKNNLRKEALIEAVAQILSFEYYQSKYLEETNVLMEDIFEYEIPNIYDFRKYKTEIFKRANEILAKYYL